jgi:hypothetical protein
MIQALKRMYICAVKIIRQIMLHCFILLFLVSTGGISYIQHICKSHHSQYYYFAGKQGCGSEEAVCCPDVQLCCQKNQTHTETVVLPEKCCSEISHFQKIENPFQANNNKVILFTPVTCAPSLILATPYLIALVHGELPARAPPGKPSASELLHLLRTLIV